MHFYPQSSWYEQHNCPLLCKWVHITFIQYSQVHTFAGFQTTTSCFQLWTTVRMCLRLIAAILLSAPFFYGAKSQQANSNIAKQKRSQTATWLEIPKAPLDLPITCLLPWRHGMRTHSQRRVPGKRRGWLKCEASSDLLLLQSVTTAAVLALLAVPCSITKAKKIEYLSQPCVILK